MLWFKRRATRANRALVESAPVPLDDGVAVPSTLSYAFLLVAFLLFCAAMAFAQAAHAAIGESSRVMGEMEAQILVDLIIAGLTVLLNGAVTYGVTMTQLRWLRTDLNRHETDIEKIRDWQNEHVATFHERRSSSRRDRATD